MEQKNYEILVSACIITYNHEKYIRQCLDGAVNQIVDFPYEIVVGVDKSDDNTKAICEEYQQKYPHLIRLFTHEVRLGMKGNSMDSIFRCRGKYIALCEGDDRWINDHKLQKQVDFLEKNPDCSMCYHPSRIVYAGKANAEKITGPRGKFNKSSYKFNVGEVISHRLGIWTASIIFKSEVLKQLPSWTDKITFGDVALKLFCATKGKLGYIGPEAMSIYNRGVENAWSFHEGQTIEWEDRRVQNHIEVLDHFNEYTDHKYQKEIDHQKRKMRIQYLLNGMKFYSGKEKRKFLLSHKELLFKFGNKLTFLVWFRYLVGDKIYNKVIK